ncbi:cytochrome b5 [Myriangium duriaei CBS 260.36]|uniref:Cytochrome b5 n=1 Tax=Myriangium duriaei CBS 260.36 TaxID=1168546 RepID=A0A9P4JDD5_9PEZI|nr:cytochrome b5 [Myriangium duriaei CBS 260.36]
MPPPRGPSTLGPPATPASNGLRLPSTGPLPNRGPPTSTGLAPSANTAGKRNKIQLKPGHSPLDWATLTRSGKNLAGVPGLQRVTPSMLKFHHGRKGRDAWASYRGKVYNISPYLPFHPGGEGELMRAAGKDGEKLFMEYHPWVNWDNMLGSCLVGIMVSEGSGEGLDDLD